MIRWITENLGTCSSEELSKQHDANIVDVRDMVDKGGNPSEIAKQKIEEALLYLEKGGKVIICCEYGMSRSNAIASGVLAKFAHIPFNEAIRKVISATEEKSVKVEVLSAVRKAIENSMDSDCKNKTSYKRILVTGGSGTLGAPLIPKLQMQHEVFTPKREDINLLNGPVELDLMVKEQKIDTIVHLANPHIYTTNAAMGETLIMLKNVLDVCRENSVKLVYPSGWEIYSGYRSQFLLASENLPPFPKGPYGETKYLCEILLDHHQKQYGVDYVIIRSSPVYGTGSKPNFIYNFLKKAIHNEEIITHKYLNGFSSLDLLHINDFISAMLAVIEGNVTGFFNIGSGIGISTTEVAQQIIKLLDSNSIIKHLEIQDFAPNIAMDTKKAREELSWEPKVSIQEGVRKLVSNLLKLEN